MDKKIEKAKKVINEGGVVIFPTETAYGLAADATNEEAVEKVYKMKNRPRNKGLTAIVSSFEVAKKYGDIKESESKIIQKFMPGPLTLVVDKINSELAENLNSDFVFRISSSGIARELAEVGPITATSANISGKSTSYSIDDIDEALLDKVDYIIDGGVLDDGPTSTIAEVRDSGEGVILHREGPINEEDLESVLHGSNIQH